MKILWYRNRFYLYFAIKMCHENFPEFDNKNIVVYTESSYSSVHENS